MSKVKIIDKNCINNIKTERNILSTLHNDFIVNMYYAFQDYSNVYLVIDYLLGGDLRYHIEKKKIFTEKETKFIISNIIIGLEYIHSKNIIHRDIKPENLIFDSFGYIRITDFGISKINEKDNSNESSGTPGYMAPEVLFFQNHSFPVDYYALGIICYELCLGKRPYLGDREEIKEKMLNKQIELNDNELPFGWSEDFISFTNLLLEIRIEERLGSKNGSKELKKHPWIKDINWDDLTNKKIEAPFIPSNFENNFDKKYCEYLEIPGRETMTRYRKYLEINDFDNIFKGYTFVFQDKNNDIFSLKDIITQKDYKILSNSTKNSKSRIITFINGLMLSPSNKVALSQKQTWRKILFCKSYSINILPINPNKIKKYRSSDPPSFNSKIYSTFSKINQNKVNNLYYICSNPNVKNRINSKIKSNAKLRQNKKIKTINSSYNLTSSIIESKSRHTLKNKTKSSNYIMSNTTSNYLRKRPKSSKIFHQTKDKTSSKNFKFLAVKKITDLPGFKNKLNSWIQRSLLLLKIILIIIKIKKVLFLKIQVI
jgi:serine/threonine protein kinase